MLYFLLSCYTFYHADGESQNISLSSCFLTFTIEYKEKDGGSGEVILCYDGIVFCQCYLYSFL